MILLKCGIGKLGEKPMALLPETVSELPSNGYHNGNTKNGTYAPKPPLQEREIIAWDMEGMSLSGDDKPQHPILFGNSIEPDKALVSQRLRSLDMLQYVIDVGQRYPNALHVGYAFKYDVCMMLQDLPEQAIRLIWKSNHIKLMWPDRLGQRWYWTLQYYPGKKFTVTRSNKSKNAAWNGHNKQRTTVTIYDYSSFFGGKKFINAAEEILREDLNNEDRKTIEHGKIARGFNVWEDLSSVRHYWEREIHLISRTFQKFRDVMVRAGFNLKEWYGPGAIANFINARNNIRAHLGAAQSTTGYMPTEVHQASKIAFSGGRFEAFQLGRHEGPIHAIDINSAYPYALTMIPSLHPDNGEWRHETNPTRIERFGFYRIQYRASKAQPIEFRPMPLFWRDSRGLISYPNYLEGWYASPEARMVASMPGVRIVEGWVWDHTGHEFPWRFLEDMYDARIKIGKNNLMSLPFKLGPNSLYGKYAQTVGWDEKHKKPPKSHALPVAAWITSMCRAMLWDVIRHAPDKIIAVETDSVYSTVPPDKLGIETGQGLGEWSHDIYEEIVYLQSGMYLTKKDGEWKGVRSRGIGRHEFEPESICEYLQRLKPGDHWEPYTITTKPRFIGMGAALASDNFAANYCTWQRHVKDITFGDTGKRRHHQEFCRACQAGMTPWDGPHRTFVASTSNGEMSFPRRLPWEAKYSDAVQRMRDAERVEKE